MRFGARHHQKNEIGKKNGRNNNMSSDRTTNRPFKQNKNWKQKKTGFADGVECLEVCICGVVFCIR